ALSGRGVETRTAFGGVFGTLEDGGTSDSGASIAIGGSSGGRASVLVVRSSPAVDAGEAGGGGRPDASVYWRKNAGRRTVTVSTPPAAARSHPVPPRLWRAPRAVGSPRASSGSEAGLGSGGGAARAGASAAG